MITTKAQLDKIAVDYHLNDAIPDIHIENTCQKYFIPWLIKHIKPGSRVLEMGFGDGLVTEALSSIDCQLTLLEGAKRLAEEAKNKHPEIYVKHTMFEDYIPEVQFDLVLASHVLEHLDDPVDILNTVKKWVKIGGVIVIVVPNKNSIHRQLAVAMGLQPALDTLSDRDFLVGHQRVYSLDTLTYDIEKANLEILSKSGFFLKVLPNSMMLDYSQELLWALNKISDSVPDDLLANIAIVAKKNG